MMKKEGRGVERRARTLLSRRYIPHRRILRSRSAGRLPRSSLRVLPSEVARTSPVPFSAFSFALVHCPRGEKVNCEYAPRAHRHDSALAMLPGPCPERGE